MKKISVEKLNPGDIVAKDVVKKNGTLLVKANTEITPELIERLKKINISYVYIQAEDKKEGYQEKIKFFKERLDRLDFLFRKHDSDEFMVKMKLFFKKYFKNKIYFLLKEVKSQIDQNQKSPETDNKESQNGRPNN